MGLPFAVPTKYLSWVELFLIYILVPRSSFFGHLCGILAGTLCNTPHPLFCCVLLFIEWCALLDSSGYLEGIFQTVEGMLPFEGGEPHQPSATTSGNSNNNNNNNNKDGPADGVRLNEVLNFILNQCNIIRDGEWYEMEVSTSSYLKKKKLIDFTSLQLSTMNESP
jgi:hypothetical protein